MRFVSLTTKGVRICIRRGSLRSLTPREPADWATEFGEDGERYAYPPPLNSNGFFEDFFEADKEAVATFWRVVNQRLAAA